MGRVCSSEGGGVVSGGGGCTSVTIVAFQWRKLAIANVMGIPDQISGQN